MTKEEILKGQKRELHPANVYEVEIIGGDTARANARTAAESEAFTPAMKDAALLRWRALGKLMASFVDEQLAKIERKIASL